MLDFDELLAAHKAQLGRAVERFREANDADFARHLQLAARWLDRRWPNVQIGELSLTVGVGVYAAPAGCVAVYAHDWGRYYRTQPWDETGPGYPPLLQLIINPTQLYLSPAPTSQQILLWGSVLAYRYRLPHVITATEMTVDDARHADVLLAALIEAMRDLSTETAAVQLQKGLTGLPNAGSPAYLYQALINEWERR